VIGVVFGSLTPPEELARGAALAERLGFSELWFSEDCFFTGGLSGLTQLLASTSAIPAGLGLASVVTRHPAILAMELAGLTRMHPGRVKAAVGLGNRQWLAQMGLLPQRPLSTVLETYDTVRRLLAGGTVPDDIQLSFPPKDIPPLWIGAVNEKALRAAGATADGVLLSVLSGPTYIRWAREQVAIGAAAANRDVPPITAFVLASVGEEAAAQNAVKGAVEFFATAEAHTALVTRSREPGEFAVAGTAEQVGDQLAALLDAGADSLGLWLFPPENLGEQLERIAQDVLPRVRGLRG
jgi:alkanesulfonate monooxygenase SsuD/methylene tetrahydromethanopterin reductase-like flavin-dependent oxidoreductase (luciferase family)